MPIIIVRSVLCRMIWNIFNANHKEGSDTVRVLPFNGKRLRNLPLSVTSVSIFLHFSPLFWTRPRAFLPLIPGHNLVENSSKISRTDVQGKGEGNDLFD